MSVTLRYPSNITDFGSYMTMVRYFHEGYTTDKLRRPQNFQVKTSVGTSFGLPMPIAISDGISITWNDESDQSLIGQVAKDAITKQRIGNRAFSEYGFQTGQAQEKHASQIFMGVSAKSYTFSWDLTPQSKQEADAIEEIIYQINEGSLPNLTANGEMFRYPDIFKIRFSGESAFKSMKFLPCVVTNVRVDYNPDGAFISYADGNVPRQILTVSFSEITSRNRQTLKTLHGRN